MTTENLNSSQDDDRGRVTAWPPATEDFLSTAHGGRLFTRLAEPPATARAVVVLAHGFGEHSGRYGHVAKAFLARGWAVAGWDLRGHGRSSGARGDIARMEWLAEDLAAVCVRFRREGCPVFVFAHSLGGQIALRLLEKEPGVCRGAVVASPWLRLAYNPPWWKVGLARLAMWFWPGFAQRTGMRPERLSRDLEHLMSFPDPSLVHQRLSARMYFASRAAGEELLAGAGQLRTPLLLLHGDDDPITCHRTTVELFGRAGSADKTLRIYPAGRHETHNDLDRELVLREVAEWMEARVGEEPGARSQEPSGS